MIRLLLKNQRYYVRTAEKIKEILIKHGSKDVRFEILSNPEFLAEGTALKDLFKSDRVLIGGDSTPSGHIATQALVNIYTQWISEKNFNY